MKRNTTTTLLSLLALLTLIGLSIWMGLKRSGTPQTATQPAQNVPLDSRLAVVTFMHSVNPTITSEPLTQKEELFVDSVNGISMKLQHGLYTKVISTDAGASLLLRNFDFKVEIQQDWPVNWIVVSIDIRDTGTITTQKDFEQYEMDRRQNQIAASLAREPNSDFRYEALEPINLGPYHGYAYAFSGTNIDAPFSRNQAIDLLLENGRIAQIIVSNTDSPDYAKVIASLNALVFAPRTIQITPMQATPTIVFAIPFTGTTPVYPTFEPEPLPTFDYRLPAQ